MQKVQMLVGGRQALVDADMVKKMTKKQELVASAMRESRCQPDAFNPKDPNGGSYGVMQVNGFWAQKTTAYPKGYLQTMGVLTHVDELFNRETNLRAALAIYRYSNGWRAWGK